MLTRTPHHFTILIIDRYEPIQKLYAMEFEEEGFDVMTAGSIPEGMMLMEKRIPDLIIADIREFDGMGNDELIASDGIGLVVPLIITSTSLPFPPQVPHVQAVDYVMKSSDLNELKEKAIQACSRDDLSIERKNRLPEGTKVSIL